MQKLGAAAAVGLGVTKVDIRADSPRRCRVRSSLRSPDAAVLEAHPSGSKRPCLTLTPSTPRRSLVLAGGGMRVAYQAGVIRALAEAGVAFEHADGTSGGIINLAMLLSGRTRR